MSTLRMVLVILEIFFNFRLIFAPNLHLHHFTIKEVDKDFRLNIDQIFSIFLRLGHLNGDFLLQMVSYLSFIDIINFNLSHPKSQSFTYQIYQKRTYFSYGAEFDDPLINDSNLETVLQKIGSYIESIDWHYLKPSSLDCLSKYCPNVNTLKLVHPLWTLNAFDIFRNNKFFAKIERLDVVDACFYDSTMKALVSSSELKTLHLTSCYQTNGRFFSEWTNSKLKFLKISNCHYDSGRVFDFVQNNNLVTLSYDTGTSFQQFLSLRPECLSELEELQLDISYFTDDTLEAFKFGDLQRLTHLTFTFTSGEGALRNYNGVLTAVSQIPTLISLTVEGMEVNEETLNCLELLKNLRTIHLGVVKNLIGSQFYRYLHVHLPKITELSISLPYVPFLQPTTICEMISSFHNLEYFCCYSTSRALLDNIRDQRNRTNQQN